MIRRRLVAGVVVGMAATLVVSWIGIPPAGARASTVQEVPGLSGLADLWCRADGTCLGVGWTPERTGAVVVLRSTGVGPVRPVPGTRSLSAITCRPTGSCVAVGQGGRGAVVVDVAADGTPGAVRSAPEAIELYDVACPTATTCLATGRRLVPRPEGLYPDAPSPRAPVLIVLNSGEPARAQWYPRGSPLVYGIACPTATRCLAVGGEGIAVLTGADGSWTASVRHTPGRELVVRSPDDCDLLPLAGGVLHDGRGMGHGRVRRLSPTPAIMPLSPDGVPGPVQRLNDDPQSVGYQGLAGISCVADGVCTLVGRDNRGFGIVIDVRPGSPPVVTPWPNLIWFTGVSCPTATTCGMTGASAGASRAPVFVWRS